MILKKNYAILIIILFSFTPSMTQEKWEWPEHPINLKVLPSGLSAAQLRSAMLDFTSSLGVRCIYCHEGSEKKPFSEWDFASDQNPNKLRAREMIRMIYDIDDHLAKINPSGVKRVEVSCYTCHHGRPKPMTLNDEINEAYRKNGLGPAIEYLSELKKEYYGKGVYNFESDRVLIQFGHSLLDSSKTEEAVRVFKLNLENFPESSRTWSSLAEAYLQSGNKAEAVKSYERSLELNPRNRKAKEMLDQLKE